MTERMFHRTQLYLAAALLFGSCGLAQAASFFVDPSHYALYNCDQLNTAHKQVGARVAELKGLMAKAETGFAGALMSGLAYQSEYVTARGELEQIDENRQKLNCGPLPVEKPAQAVAPETKQKHRKKH
ncbi:MAG: twin-arginine translocation pathway signal [Bradyrhizobiaceae bacterium]|nr:MAG: twin-arginine translocation pathway signal [Bradyrhizobiaceae bacterium]